MPTDRQLYNRPGQKSLRRDLRTHGTPAEATLWRMLSRRQVCGLLFRRQYGVGPYVLDFYCPALRLCIELDGEPHTTPDAIEHDALRDAFLRTHRIRVLRFENRLVFDFPEAILAAIEQAARDRASAPTAETPSQPVPGASDTAETESQTQPGASHTAETESCSVPGPSHTVEMESQPEIPLSHTMKAKSQPEIPLSHTMKPRAGFQPAVSHTSKAESQPETTLSDNPEASSQPEAYAREHSPPVLGGVLSSPA